MWVSWSNELPEIPWMFDPFVSFYRSSLSYYLCASEQIFLSLILTAQSQYSHSGSLLQHHCNSIAVTTCIITKASATSVHWWQLWGESHWPRLIPAGKLVTQGWWVPLCGGQRPISLEYQICTVHTHLTLWYSSNWNDSLNSCNSTQLVGAYPHPWMLRFNHI